MAAAHTLRDGTFLPARVNSTVYMKLGPFVVVYLHPLSLAHIDLKGPAACDLQHTLSLSRSESSPCCCRQSALCPFAQRLPGPAAWTSSHASLLPSGRDLVCSYIVSLTWTCALSSVRCPDLAPGHRPLCAPRPAPPGDTRETSFTLHGARSSSPLPGVAESFRGDRGALLGLDVLLDVSSQLFYGQMWTLSWWTCVSASGPGRRDSERSCFNKGENNA